MSPVGYRFTQSANLDINVIWESIAEDNLQAADRVVSAVYEHVRLLVKFPRAGHLREDLAGQRSLLFSPVGNYIVAYREERQELIVIAVLHAARDIPRILRHRSDER